MIKDLSLKSKFEFLGDFLTNVLHDIRKDVRQEHLKQDLAFTQKYFGKKFFDKVPQTEIDKAYFKEIVEEGNQELADWIISKWIIKHAEIYEFFASELSRVNPDFEKIEILSLDSSKDIVARSVQNFGVKDTYIFSLLNSVAFEDKMFEYLKNEAVRELENKEISIASEKALTVEQLQEKHAAEILKLSERYEKRIQAVSKKYMQDIEGLKKQIGMLQRKISEPKCC